MDTPDVNIGYYKTRLYGWTLLTRNNISLCAVRPGQSESIPDGSRSNSEAVNCSAYARVFKSQMVMANRIYCLYLKFFLYRSVKDFLVHLVRPSRAARAFKAGQMLSGNNLNAPVCLAIGHKKLLGIFNISSFLITAEVKNAAAFYELLDEFAQKKNRLCEKRKLIRTLGYTIGRMHRTGIFHGDLRLGNILVQRQSGQFKFIFLDNERTRQFSSLPLRCRIKNLVQLAMHENSIAGTDRMRFLTAYLDECDNCPVPAKQLAQRVRSKTVKRLNKKMSKTKTV